MRRGFIFGFILLSVILVAALVQANIQSCKDDFKATESVHAKSLAKICYTQLEGGDVDLYIVEDKDAVLLITLATKKIKNSQFPCQEVWADPSPGEYELFVDCNLNGKYDADANEPFDNFTVTAVAGTGRAERAGELSNYAWMYDSEDQKLSKEVLKISLFSEGEDIELRNISIKSSGPGNDSEIESIDIYASDVLIGSVEPAYSQDNGEAVIFPDFLLEQGIAENISIVYNMKETTPEGNYSFSVNSINGEGLVSQKIITFAGLPINSGVLTVLSEKTCLGELTLALESNPVASGMNVVAAMQGLTGCENKKIILRPNPCGSSLQNEVCSCISGADGCSCNLTSSTSKTLYACIDKNQDNDMIDFGEYDFEDLVITEPEPETEEAGGAEEIGIGENITEINITEETGEKTGITGGVISKLKGAISGTSILFILLEITLLLILLVLVVIMFRLKSSRSSEITETGDEKKKETAEKSSRRKNRIKKQKQEPAENSTTEEI